VKQYGRYFAGLIGLYILVAHGSDTGKVFTAGANGVGTITQKLQGR
jgi:hypothetical protein